jgi:hypothetical protein
MPTAHRHHAITGTDDISDALNVARRAWPELADRPGALRQLILVGRNTLTQNHAAADRKRQQDVEVTNGALAVVFGPDYLKKLREDWAE